MNRADMMGRLTRDPETTITTNGICVSKFSIAVPKRFKKEGQPDADFFPVVAWRNTAKFVDKYFAKGMRVVVCGHIEINKWIDGNGMNKERMEIVADEVHFADAPKEKKATKPPSDKPFGDMTEIDEELPF